MDIPMMTGGDIAPTNTVPVVATSAVKRLQGGFPMRWWFTHPVHNVLVFNTRSETTAEKPLFNASIQERRCAVPASCYFEWKKESGGKKTKYAFQRENNEPLYLAGLYLRIPDFKMPCFTILTMDATDGIQDIHTRMPVILPQALVHDWLSPKTHMTH